jgi:hypothetical protein
LIEGSREARLSIEDHDKRPRSSVPPSGQTSGPWAQPAGRPAAGPVEQPPAPVGPARRGKWRRPASVALFLLIMLSVGARAFRDLSQPEAWAYWKDLYFSPSLTSSLTTLADPGGSPRRVAALVVRGRIGAAAASWFRERVDEAHLAPGDVVLLSSPGGDLGQAIIMGEIIRSRGLSSAVGVVNGPEAIARSYCASACVLVYAGGKTRFGVEGSHLGVHRFVTAMAGRDPIAETQRTTGMVLGYMTKMGVSSSIVEAMSATSDVRWLDAKEAEAMNLVTDPVRTR